MCPGRQFAAVETKLFVAYALRYFNFELMEDVPGVNDKIPRGAVMKPLKDILVKISVKQ